MSIRVAAVLDACVLYPTVMREVLVGVAARGLFRPIWSERLLEEWARAAARRGPADEAYARGEIARLNAQFPEASHVTRQGIEAKLWLPDEGDIHVLATAVSSGADVIVTMNARDFPRGMLADEALSRADPDGFLLGYYHADPDAVRAVCADVLAEARRLSGQDWQMRALMKKARLPRLGRALERGLDVG